MIYDYVILDSRIAGDLQSSTITVKTVLLVNGAFLSVFIEGA